jgi:hypothetical protein
MEQVKSTYDLNCDVRQVSCPGILVTVTSNHFHITKQSYRLPTIKGRESCHLLLMACYRHIGAILVFYSG